MAQQVGRHQDGKPDNGKQVAPVLPGHDLACDRGRNGDPEGEVDEGCDRRAD